MDSLTFLDRAGQGRPVATYVLHGDEPFLKRQVLGRLRAWVLGGEENEVSLSNQPGERAVWAAVHDELTTLPFLGGHRLVVVDGADPFVTKYRQNLEKYVATPSSTGVLVLDVKTWPSNTKLAKLLPDEATIVCKAPKTAALPPWCIRWAKAQYQKQLTAPAAKLLVDLIGPEMGLLDQELAKLAIYVDKAARIDTGDVDRLVGNSRAEDVWQIFDAIGAAQPGTALTILDRLLDQGNDPILVLGAISYQLRLLARVWRLNSLGRPIPAVLADLGIQSWKGDKIQHQMRHLGPFRLNRLYDWLLEVDMGMKGSSQLPPRLILERLIVRLAQEDPKVPARGGRP